MHDEQSIVKFWEWFTINEHRFIHLRSTHSPLLDLLLAKLSEVKRGLYCDLGIAHNPKILTITACGNNSLFETVDKIVSLAPPLSGWKFEALLPARGFDFTTTILGCKIKANELWFLAKKTSENQGSPKLKISLPQGISPSKEAANAVLMILDMGLGERETASAFSHVEIVAYMESPEEKGFNPIVKLPELLHGTK